MKVGQRGQVTIPKEFRERFGLSPQSEIEFVEIDGRLTLRKKTDIAAVVEKWKGSCAGSLERLGVSSVDELIEAMRGR